MRVVAARNLQLRRFFDEKIYTNAERRDEAWIQRPRLRPHSQENQNNRLRMINLQHFDVEKRWLFCGF